MTMMFMRRLAALVIIATTLLPSLGNAQTVSCISISRTLSLGSRGAEVIKLQNFLISQNLLASGSNGGFFGRLTQRAVQQWQKKNGIVSSGTPATTGYGAAGAKTRAAIANICRLAVNPSPPYGQGSYVGAGSYSQGTYYAQGSYSSPPSYTQGSYYSEGSYYAQGSYTPAATLCSALNGLSGSNTDASVALQSCFDGVATSSILELPAGRFTIQHQVKITKPMTLRTQGKTDAMARCDLDDSSCAQIIASPDLVVERWGMMTIQTDHFTLDHIIINGNHDQRTTSRAAQLAQQSGDNGYEHNLVVLSCSNCQFSNSVIKNALGATAFGWGITLHDHDSVIRNNLIAYNGRHDQNMLWSDGFTFLDGEHFTITDNEFVDNTDVQLIMGGCTHCTIQRNTIRHTGTFQGGSFAAVTFQQWLGSSNGDYSGSDFSQNSIDCSLNRRCGFGLYIGSGAWGVTPTMLKGASIHDNIIKDAEQGFAADAATEMQVTNNVITGANNTFPTSIGARAMNLCNISPTASIAMSGTSPDASVCSHNAWTNEIPNYWTADWMASRPSGLTAVCASEGTHATLSWNASPSASSYLLRADDTTNQASGCTTPTISGPGAQCVSPTDYVSNPTNNSVTISVPSNTLITWWVHAVTADGAGAATIGTAFTCMPH